MKNSKKRMISVIFINLGIAIAISVATAKLLPLIYVTAKLGVGIVLSKVAKLGV